MKQSLLIISGLSDSNNKFGLDADTDDDDDKFQLFDDDIKEDDDQWYPSELYTGWDYKKDFGEDA